MSARGESSPERVLVLTPTGRDAAMVRERLTLEGFACEVCDDLDELVSALREDAGAVLIAQEALGPGKAEVLLAALQAQEPWSDVPVLLLTLPLSKRVPYAHPAVRLLERANVTLLQRPMPVHLLCSALLSAVRARRRQYQMRDLNGELSRAVQLGDLFVGILGHDLRTPLGAIKMSAELIVRSVEDERCLRPAGRILSATDRMTRMIGQLLDFARARQGDGIQLRLVPVNLSDVVGQVLQELGDANPKARINLLSSGGSFAGRWDPDRLGQIVSNLVGNAVQHGNLSAPICVQLDGTEPKIVHLSVANQGSIANEAIPTLFEPFKRTTTTQGGERGLGLGLFIARELVRAHGGDLQVRSSNGTVVFEFALPRQASTTSL